MDTEDPMESVDRETREEELKEEEEHKENYE